MYKKESFRELDKKYNSHLYSGLLGVLMDYCHKKLENFNKKDSYDKILEIGAGSAPHLDYLSHSFKEYHIAETSDYASSVFKENSKKNVYFKKYDGKKLPYDDDFFDRIIISHCLEHILSPEEFIFEMMKKLKKGGVLSISLPTDPGIAWRLGRLFIRLFSIKKTRFKLPSPTSLTSKFEIFLNSFFKCLLEMINFFNSFNFNGLYLFGLNLVTIAIYINKRLKIE